MTLDDIVGISIPIFFALFLLVERIVPGRSQPKVAHWWKRGLAFFFMVGAMNAILPVLLLSAIGDVRVFHASELGTIPSVLLLLLFGDLGGYWIHRAMHRSKLLWRFTHQMHHSPERMDMLGASYFHPLDFLLQNVLFGTLALVLIGPSPVAAAIGGFLGFFFGVSPHLNVKTPRWLGYIIQRPEMHAVHHLRDVHAYNYGSLAFSDMLYGTWRNPEGWPQGEFGFWDGASSKIGAMLIGRDVTEPPSA